jgi:cytochrome c oxidase subunit 2
MLALALAGCGSSAAPGQAQTSSSSSVPAYVIAPFSHEQKLVEQGAHMVVSDGCSVCHLMTGAHPSAPSFLTFAGHHVTLSDGRSVLVDERFMREGLLHPSANELKGYDPTPMLAALAHEHLASHPQEVVALAAFIEQIGPETE